MKRTKYSKNVQVVIDILRDEIIGNTSGALKKMTRSYTMTWVYETKAGTLFPKTAVSEASDLEDAYIIKGRKYEIMRIAEGKDVIIVELIESYPDTKTKKTYCTPLVLVLEMKNGKIETGRHYCDPRLSYRHLTAAQTNKAFAKKQKPLVVIE
jgi:ketosteroid isomerase-like protein